MRNLKTANITNDKIIKLKMISGIGNIKKRIANKEKSRTIENIMTLSFGNPYIGDYITL